MARTTDTLRKIANGDISINGSGFYTISAHTPQGRKFMKLVDGAQNGVAYSDQTGMTQDIADGAFESGLTVTVNGRSYLGNNRVA